VIIGTGGTVRHRRASASLCPSAAARTPAGTSALSLHLTLGVVMNEAGVAREVLRRRRRRDRDGDGVIGSGHVGDCGLFVNV
jgi:hypothetical protein